jgi:glyoxylase-like metal-dependent hydrolase (beta-lactamase superfamily II)
MLKVHNIKVGQLRTNCCLVYIVKTRKALIIDPGDDADYIMRVISDLNLKPAKIIATHGHFDHVLAANELKFAFGIPFLIHKEDKFLIDRVQSTAKRYLGINVSPPPAIDEYLTGKKKLKIGNHKLKIIHTPGHTPGGVSLYCQNSKFAAVGDLVFDRGIVGRTDFSYSSKHELQKSVRKICKLPEDTKLLPGHGRSSEVSLIKKYF